MDGHRATEMVYVYNESRVNEPVQITTLSVVSSP